MSHLTSTSNILQHLLRHMSHISVLALHETNWILSVLLSVLKLKLRKVVMCFEIICSFAVHDPTLWHLFSWFCLLVLALTRLKLHQVFVVNVIYRHYTPPLFYLISHSYEIIIISAQIVESVTVELVLLCDLLGIQKQHPGMSSCYRR